jgi:hypothetical protein
MSKTINLEVKALSLSFVATILFIFNLTLAAFTADNNGIISYGSLTYGAGTLLISIPIGYGIAWASKISTSKILRLIYGLIFSLIIIMIIHQEQMLKLIG